MSDSRPLSGLGIAVTRPREQAGPLAAAIASAGGTPLLLPLLEISPPHSTEALEVAAGTLDDAALAVFISPNAVDHALPTLLARGPWPPSLRPAAVGPGTARALAAAGIPDCLLPEQRFDSEGLLARPELAAEHIAGRHVLIFRGDGGRELLADTLTARGARVECITCYRRHGPAGLDDWQNAWRERRLHGITLSSSEALRYLLAGLTPADRQHLQATPLFVPHQRIADVAAQNGLTRIVLSDATDDGLFRALLAYNWSA